MARSCVVRRRRARGAALAARDKSILEKLSPALKARMSAINERAAKDHAALVARIIPVGDPERGNLVTTLKVEPSERQEVAFLVSIGGPQNPYPMHLEVGHRARDGSHVEGLNYWFPPRRIVQRRRRAAAKAAMQDAIDDLTGGL